jgi:cell division protease FtsH
MTVLLGGRVAEQIVFGAVTTGAANDLQRVEEITHAMIHQYAMGSGDAPQSAVKDQDALSDLTRRIRDEEQRELAFEAHRTAWELVTSHRELLDRIASELLENETLERGQLDRIMEGVPRMEPRRPVPDLRVAASEKPSQSAE